MKSMLALILLSSVASAVTTTQSKEDSARIMADLEGKTISARMKCEGDDCLIDYTLKAGENYALIDRRGITAALLAELAVIEGKDDAGTPLTAAEQRRWRKIVMKLVRIRKDAP